MKRVPDRKKRQVGLIFLGMMCVCLAVPVVLTWRQVRQERLNHALIAAVKANDDKAVVSLVNQGADANTRDEHRAPVPFWRSLVDLLRGSKPKPSSASTPLLLALRWLPETGGNESEGPPQNVTLIRVLLEHGADPNCRNEDDQQALLLAIMQKKAETVHLLLAHGADVHGAEMHGDGLLDTEVMMDREHPDVIQDLLDHGENVNQLAAGGIPALWEAAVYNNVAGVRVLLAHHANVAIRAGWPREVTPLAAAKESGRKSAEYFDNQKEYAANREVIRLLKAAGAKE